MKTISILNHVLGPVMRGPSSSHTAGAFHIGSMARSLLRATPGQAVFTFDPSGSYAATYAEQGADRGFAMGLMGKPLTDDSFFTALDDAAAAGLKIEFRRQSLRDADHPNTVHIQLTSLDGMRLNLMARSIGGGEVEITRINDAPVLFNGSAFEVLVETSVADGDAAHRLLVRDDAALDTPVAAPMDNRVRMTCRRRTALPEKNREALRRLSSDTIVLESAPVYYPHLGPPLFTSASELMRMSDEKCASTGDLALAYEARLLGMSEADVLDEVLRRYDIMVAAVEKGLDPEFSGLQLLPACAGAVFDAEAHGRLATRSLHTRAAARAMAVMHVDGAMGVVCAAPTGGSAGVLPGTLVTLAEERSLKRDQIGRALLSAGAIGAILAIRATFAAEVAGCQVEIGASGAMAAAAVVDAVGGTAKQACDAAAVAFQNTMGSVCDLVQGTVEIPCHTRNAVAAATAFVNADLILGGYPNLVPLDETIDAVYAVGRALPPALRCTSQGGLAIAPSAKGLCKFRR